MARITIEGVSKSYDGETNAADDLNFVIEDSEFITLLGPSGCGKSTTLNLLAGFLAPDTGRILVGDRVVSSPEETLPPERRDMGMVFQSYALWPHKTVLQNVVYGLRRQKVPKKDAMRQAQDMLEVVGLPAFGDRSPGQLSGGQQQRVALARSLVTNPSILLLDEPLSNLDAKLRDKMRYEVQDIQKRTDTTFVYVTHDQVEAMAMSDRVAVMELGKLRQYAPPRQVYQSPATPYVADFMGLTNMLPGEAVKWNKDGSASVDLDIGARIPVRRSNLKIDNPGEKDLHVAVSLRPETFTIFDDVSLQGDSYVHGVVEHVTVLGNVSDYYIKVRGVTIRVQADFTVDIDEGAEVSLFINPAHAVAFPYGNAEQYLTGLQVPPGQDEVARERSIPKEVSI